MRSTIPPFVEYSNYTFGDTHVYPSILANSSIPVPIHSALWDERKEKGEEIEDV